MKAAERTGTFYLGKIVDPSTGKTTSKAFEYNAKDLTTHAVTVGMTGSGKTGLALAMIEEAGLNKIPAILIDPKGDLGDLLLTFPHLSPEEFKPWVDKGASAEEVAKKWKEGLAGWEEGAEQIKQLKENVEIVIYTPASQAGRSLSILSSFAAPPKNFCSILKPFGTVSCQPFLVCSA